MTYGWTDAVDDMNKSYIDKLNGLSLTVKKKSVSVRRLIVTLRKGAFFLSTGAMPNTIKFDFKVSGKSKLKPHVPLKA